MNIEQFSKEHLSAVLDALIRVKGGEITDTDAGICNNAESLVYKELLVKPCGRLEPIWRLSKGWCRYSGNKIYPVPSVDIYHNSEEMYHETDNLWEGEYGALRYELLDFLIDELTKVVEKCDDGY